MDNRIGSAGLSEGFDARIAAVAAGQYGVFTVDEVLGCGGSPRMVQRRVLAGRWESVGKGVYRLAGAAPSWRQDVMAACKRAGPAALASHQTAAKLYRLPAGQWSPLHITVPFRGRSKDRMAVIHRSRAMPQMDACDFESIPTTTVVRTLIDLAGVLSCDESEANFDFVLSRGYAPRIRLAARVEVLAGKGVPGIEVARDILAARAPDAKVPDSILETTLARVLKRLKPVWGYQVVIKGRVRVLDCAFPSIRLAVEADGWANHCGRQQWEDDISRQNALVTARWTVLRYPWSVIKGQPDFVFAEVLQMWNRLTAASLGS